MSYKVLLFTSIACLLLASGLSAQLTPFDSIYYSGTFATSRNLLIAQKCIDELRKSQKQLTSEQQAKISFLQYRIIASDTVALKLLERRIFTPPDSMDRFDAVSYTARRYLERSMPDKAIPLLLNALGEINVDSDQADFCTIELCEGYRQKKEYKKGIDLLKELLSMNRKISDRNRAYAYNRLAALFNEWANPVYNTADSVIKYSNLCIRLSEDIGDRRNLAYAQNELSVQFARKNQIEEALQLSALAVRNFKEEGMNFSTMNALINQSYFYTGLHRYDEALQALLDAAGQSSLEENRNLYLRLYSRISDIYEYKGDFKSAFTFRSISFSLLAEFYSDRLSDQISELTAKYDLFTKEQKIREEQQKNRFQKRQLNMLIIIIAVLCIVLIISYFYYRLRRKQGMRQQLIEAVIETEASERKRIARDLHDGIGPVLSAVNHYFQAYVDAGEDDKKMISNKLQNVIANAIDEVSRISHNISPHVLDNYGLVTALNDFIMPFINSDHIGIDFTSDETARFELNKELTLYRCVTELINNTVKHARATMVKLDLTSRDKVVYVDYTDNGEGFEMHSLKPGGMGIRNIINRVETLGGKVLIESVIQKGTKVKIEMPVTYA